MAILALRKIIAIADLGRHLSQEDTAEHETVYQPSRGGWFPAPAKPVPGTPKKGDRK